MPSLTLLAAGLLLGGTAALPGPPTAAPVEAELELATAAGVQRAALAWSPGEQGSVRARAGAAGWEAEVELSPEPGGGQALSARVRWLAPAELEHLVLILSWPGAPSAVDRGLRFGPVTGPLRIERGTPLLVAAGETVLAGGPGLAAARVERTAGGVRVTLALDDAAARPFSTFETCYVHLPFAATGQHIPWGTFDPRRPHPYAPRAAGQEDVLRAGLYRLDEGTPFLPVVPERWPGLARAAVVFTDHADRTDPEALRAVLWGDSSRGPGSPGAGFLGRGLKLTRTFFVHGPEGSLDEPAVRALADELVAAGSEVALHSVTHGRDGREAVRAGLSDAARWAPVTWIDHEPYTNCEAISAEGWRAEGPFGVRDVLAAGGIRWVWAAGDEGKGLPRIDDLLGGRPDEARAAFAPFPLDARLWTFRSSMFYAAPSILAAALSPEELARLERTGGLFVAHTYLGPSARTTHTPDHLARLAVRPAGPGRLQLDPALDAALAGLQDEVEAGRIASLTWREAGDRLRALGDVEVAYLADGAAELRNRGEVDLPGLTVAVPVPPEVELALDGAAPLVRQDEGGVARVALDLPAGGRAVLRASRRLVPLPFLAFAGMVAP